MGAGSWLVGPSEACGAQASLQIPTSCRVGGEPEIFSEASALTVDSSFSLEAAAQWLLPQSRIPGVLTVGFLNHLFLPH